MARGKALTAEELAKLGAKQLATLLVEACESDPQLRRRIEILLATKRGPDELESTLAKRITSLSRARAFIDWREVPKLEAELAILREGIGVQLRAEDPRSASELMWRFLALAGPTIERVDDSSGRIGDEFRCAAEDLGSLLARVPELDKIGLAERLHERMAEDEYGFATLIINSAPEALGSEGRKKLRELLRADIARLPSPEEKEDWESVGWPRARIATNLANLADAEHDVDAYIEAVLLGRREHIDAAQVAKRLIEVGRATEALDWLDKDRRARGPLDMTIADLKIAALEALDRKSEAQALRWAAFEASLSATHLRGYLKRLPDFEDFPIERKAIAQAMAFPSALAALNFLIAWPSLEDADLLVRRRIAELDGRNYEALGRAADALTEKWPDSASLLYRALVLSVLERGYAKAYRYAARDLASASMLAPRLAPDGGLTSHAEFCATLKSRHGRKYAFWQLVDEQR
jgi:hypothetical protein